MAVRQFDGVDDVIRCSIGGATLTGAFTVAVLLKKTRDGRMETYVASHTSGGAAMVLLGSDTLNRPFYELNGTDGDITSVQMTQAGGWYLFAITKAAGIQPVRIHVRRLNGGAWTHANSRTATGPNPASTAGGNWRFANRGTNIFEAPRLALAGVWDVAMSDAQVEALLANTRTADWSGSAAGAPRALWELNQTSNATPVADATGNGANQVAIVGTTVVTNDDPPAWVFAGSAPPPPPPPPGNVRKSIFSLTPTEWDDFVAALNGIKANGVYDAFTRRHQTIMMALTLMPGETGTNRNGAHNGPSFLPWHRRSLREFELELQAIRPGVMIPYWGWETERTTWVNSAVWGLIGGNGNAAQGYRITTGPFANWTSVIFNDATQTFQNRAGIVRRFWNNPLPDVSPAQAITTYDVSPWRENSPMSQSFRNRIEDYHNQFHVRIGGDMQAGTASNDPVFWLHHANIDRLWARWQTARGVNTYAPNNGGPPGHNRNDNMNGLLTSVTPGSQLDWQTLGYTYDVI